MKKTIMLSGIVLLLLTFSSCLTTLHPLFKPGDVLFDAKLLGGWKSGSDNETIRFVKAGKEDFKDFSPEIQALADKAYVVTTEEDGRIAEKYFAFLLRLGNNLYIDFFPTLTPDNENIDAFYVTHFIPEHSFYKLKLNGNGELSLRMFDSKYMEKLINEKKIRIRHEARENGMLITASTEELQQYVLKYGDVENAYESVSVYQKTN